MSISFENYRKVHPYEDSDSSEDEVDWQDTRHDPYRAGEATAPDLTSPEGRGFYIYWGCQMNVWIKFLSFAFD